MTFGTTVATNTPGSTFTPDQVGEIKILHGVAGPSGSALWFDTLAIKQPLDADGKTVHIGNMGHNSLDGPGLFNVDGSVFKNFRISERFKAELLAEALNFTNTPAFADPSTTVGSADFGRVTATLAGLVANQGVGGTGSRNVQLGIKISF